MRPLLIFTLLFTALSPACAGTPTSGEFVNLGVQITSLTLQGTAFTRHPDARDLICTVIRGQPAKLLVFDLKSGELLHRLPLEGANGGWNATTASDGSVYVGSDDNGHLYRWIPGQTQARDLGQVAPDQTFAWDVAAGRDGEVFVATYPGCQAIRYHPDEGFKDVAGGNVAPPENYARSIAFEPVTGNVFVGVGAHAHLIEVDPKTGRKRDILPTKYADKKFVYSVRAAGGKLFALLQDGGPCLVIDPSSGEVEAEIPDVGAQVVVTQKSPYDDKVYIKGIGKLLSYDLKTRRHVPVDVPGTTAIIGMSWLRLDDPEFNGDTLIILAARGKLIRFDPRTGKSSAMQLTPPPERTPIHYIAKGPDGRIYTGGYLSGGLSAYDPRTGKHQQLGNMGQPEGITVMGSNMYLGIYPRARLFKYDPAQPWSGSTKNPQLLEELDRFEQDRPFATLGVEKINKVFFGTVPDYGRLGGALAVYDAANGKVDVHRDVVPEQSIVSLAYASDLIVGSTSISGGLGVKPSATEAKLFLWEPATNRKIFETVPVPGKWLITGLLNGPDGNIWGMADGTLFIFDIARREVIFTGELFPSSKATPHARWRSAFLSLHPDRRIYGTCGGRLFRLDPATKELSILRDEGASLLAVDDQGRIYFTDRTNLWQYTP